MDGTNLTISRSGAPAASTGPCRILHVVSSLEHGGIEVWLLQMLRRIDRDRYQMDFFVLRERAGALEQEVQTLGSRVLIARSPRRVWQVGRDFSNALASYGPYDVVHSHVHHFGGLIVRMAARHGVPLRVAHSHNDTRVVERHASWPRRCYLGLTRRWIRRFATDRIAVSRSAADDLFGPNWSRDPRCEIIPCGVDFTAFAGSDSRLVTRQALGLPEDASVFGHVGRFHRRKNHGFLLEIAARLFARNERAYLLLIGDGELMPEIKAQAHQLGIGDRVVFTGDRADVPILMQAMDAFVFPSHHEGLGLVLLEAQAAGLPCVLNEDLPEEADVVSSLMHRLPLTAPAAAWAERLLQVAGRAPLRRENALKAMSESEFGIERSVARLLRAYSTAAKG
jgi:glycosyltransferase involved in cell wall biosynthesis